jgi:hypothetical protein
VIQQPTNLEVRSLSMVKMGMWAALALFILGLAYFIMIMAVLDFSSPNPAPKGATLIAIDVFTLVCGILVPIMMAGVYDYASAEHKTRSLLAVGWVLVLAGITCTMHFVQLTALREVRQNDPAAVNWPSPWLAADWFVWDVFLSLSMLFAVPVFSGPGLARATRILMRSVGVLCLLGLLGPLTGRLGLQSMGGVGYGLVFPVACLLMALVLRRRLRMHAQPL